MNRVGVDNNYHQDMNGSLDLQKGHRIQDIKFNAADFCIQFMNLNNLLDDRRKLLLDYVYNRTQGVVQHGYFKGMKVLRNSKWGDGDMGAKLLGTYENELFPIIEELASSSKPDLIVNYGCAEGFYGIGMAIKFPDAKSVLFDIEEALLEIAKQNAELNNIKNCEFTSRCNDLEFFENLLRQAKSPLIIMDCEGHEAYILEPDRVPSLKKSTLLVEIHEFLKVGLTDLIAKKFHKSHDVKVLLQGAKNYHIEPILAFSDVDKFIINNENRPCTMHWMYMTPKG